MVKMKKPLFTQEELEELARADAELDETFLLTNEDLKRSRAVDRMAELENMEPEKRKIAAQQAAYREANKDKIAAQKAAYREAHREEYNAYMREYLRKRRNLRKQERTVSI